MDVRTEAKPIIFSSEMVETILDGRKTQTRRVIKQLTPPDDWSNRVIEFVNIKDGRRVRPRCPYGEPGDLLYVREKWQAVNHNGQWWHEINWEDRPLHNWAYTNPVKPAINETPPRWLASIHMPKDACRITLEIVSTWIEQVQDITPQDCQAEGLPYDAVLPATAWREAFRELWDSINAKRGYGWDVNPWVWVVEFKNDPDLATL